MTLWGRQLSIPTLADNNTFADYVTSLALPAWWRMRDTSGTTVVNSGSLGSALNLTATAWTMAQAGQLGAGEAGLADGANTRLQCANNATLAGYTTWEWGFLINPSNAGEASAGFFICWGNGAAPDYYSSFNSAITALRVGVYNSLSTLFQTITTTGLTASVYQLLFVAFDGSKCYLRVGRSGAVTEATYSAQPALTGTYAPQTSVLNVLNNTAQSRTFDGLCDEVFCIGGRTFTPAERLQLTLLAGV